MDGGTDKRIFDYDSEADAYYSILGWLDQAVDEFDESSTDKILKDPAWTVAVDNLGDSGITILIRPWVKAADYWDVKWRTLERVHDRLTEANIDIPFPQMTVHLEK